MRWIEQDWWLGLVRLEVSRRTALERLGGGAAGQSTVEYALVGALVVIAAAGALTMLGGELTSVFTNISKTLGAAAGGR